MDRKHNPGGVMCSEMVSLHLQSRNGRERELKVNLEEIWSSGALFRTDLPIRPFTSLWFAGGGCEFRGQVIARTSVTGLGHFVEMRFHPSCVWSEQEYCPKHLFNPLVLLANRIFEATLHALINLSFGLSSATFARMVPLDSLKQAPAQAF
jgi:hypothetical protein